MSGRRTDQREGRVDEDGTGGRKSEGLREDRDPGLVRTKGTKDEPEGSNR